MGWFSDSVRKAINNGSSSGRTTTQPRNPSIGQTVGVMPANSGKVQKTSPIGSIPGANSPSGSPPPAVGGPGGSYNPQPIEELISDPSSDYINQLKEAQRQSRIASLDKAKAGALGELDTEQANVAPTYYDKRNQAAAASDVGAMNFANYMASRGIKGAAGAMPEIYRQAGLQQQIGALDRQEAGNMANIERQRGLIGSNYQFDVAQANADVESQAMQTLIDQYNRNKQIELDRARLTGTLGGAPTLDRQQMDAQNTGYANPWAGYALNDDIRNQLSPYMNDLQGFIDANPGSQLVPYAQNARYEKIMSSPDLQQQYGDRYRTVDGMRAGLQNKEQELRNVALEIENSFLPETLKLEAKRLEQLVKTGALDYDRALNQMNQIKSQSSNTRYTPSTNRTTEANKDVESLYSYYEKDLPQNFQERGKGIDDYAAYLVNPNVAPTIIRDIGQTRYNQLVSWANAQVEAAGGL